MTKNPGPWRRRALAVLAALFGLAAGSASAQTAAGYAEFIIPFDEDVFAYVTQPVSATTIGANDTTFTLISVTAWSDTVTIYYDHWENGYGYDPSNPDGPGTDEKYTLNAGQTLNFSSAAVPRPRTGGDGNTYIGGAGNCNAQPAPATALIRTTPNLCYDGRDRIVTVGGATTVTRGGYFNTAGMGKLAAIGEEVYPLSPQLIKYILPFGEDNTRNDYQQVLAVVQATEDNTTIQIDFNGDGVFDSFNTENGYRTTRADPVDATTVTLQRGQSYVVDRNSDGVAGGTLLAKGAVILGSKTLQVEYFYGRTGSNYDSRAVSAFPRGFWTREYYASADGGNAAVCAGGVCNTDVLLYNPNAGTLTINWETTTGTGNFTMAANETAFFQAKTGSYVPDGSGVYLSGTGTFWGTSDIDTNRNDWDWGYSLVPSYLLSQEQTVAWAPGNSAPQACNTANARGNGLFLTPVFDNTTVFIDANGDGTPDTNASIEVLRGQTTVTPSGSGYKANRLESLYITGSNVTGAGAGSLCDLTGARIYATGPFSMSYGENPDKTSAGGGLDLGYTVLPSPANWMDLALTVDKSTSPVLVSTVAGATTVTFTLVVDSHLFNIDSVSVIDTLPANWTFDANSAVITLPNLTQISGAAANPAVSLPTLTWGPGLLGSMLPNQQIRITFTARTTAAFANGAVTQNNVGAEGTRSVGGVTQTFKASDFAFNTFTDGSVGMQLTKASSVLQPTPVSPGDTLTYTAIATNSGSSSNLTGVWLYDQLPPGVTSVAGTTTLSRSSVADAFGANAYNNSNGTRTWVTDWTETVDGGSATTGDLQVVAGELRLNNDASNEPTVVRRANLAGATSAILSFSYRTSAGVDAADAVQVCGRPSTAAAWTCPLSPAGNFTGITGVSSGSYSFNLAALGALTATAEIRFQFTANTYDDTAANESFFVDNLSITYDVSVTVGNPPELLASSALYTLTPGQSLTATFNVTVDNPFPTGLDQILNVVASGASQIPVPLSASARNIVLVAGGLTGTVGDRVWLDADADGVFDPGETGIAGVEVTLKDQFGTPLQVTTTDSQGRYTFIDVAPGTGYYVEITGGLPSGLTQTTDTVGDAFDIDGVFTGNNGTLNWATDWLEAGDDFNAATGDLKIANNHIEFGGPGLVVEVNDSIQRSATVVGATTIEVQYSWGILGIDANDDTIVEYSSNGGASFTPLRRLDNGTENGPGTYTDTIAWVPTNPTIILRFRAEDAIEAGEVGTIDNVQVRFPQSQRTAAFNLAAGQDYVQADLGYRADPNTAAIGDLVWVDANNDQVRNPGEVGLAGITVDLYEDTDGDGLPNGLPVASTVTGPGGAYLFTGVPANGARDWVVTMNTGQAPLTGYTATTNTLFSFPNLPGGAVRVDADFGFRNPTSTFTITDGVWLDNGLPTGTANNGVKDGTEVGIAGVTVDLLDAAGNTIATATTGSDGKFQFTGVPGGQNYRWRITDTAGVLADYYGTTPSALSGGFQIVGNLTGNLDYTAPSDVRHFGYNQTRSIGDTVWNDINNNQARDGSEPGIGGVTLLLYLNDGDGVFEPGGQDGNPIATQVTDANGQYLFAGLAAGTYWVSIDSAQSALGGYTLTTTDGSGVAGHQLIVTPTLSGGANRLDIDFGYRAATPFAISGRFFSDLNRSGSDNSEPGFASVTVQLSNGSGVVVGTTTTDATGAYSFPGLPAGTYTVRVTDTNGVLTGYETTFERTELGLTPPYNGQETVTLGPSVANVNFGYYRGNSQPTRAIVSSFVAREVAGAVALEWTTASEVGTVGFYLERWDEREARYVAVNEKPLLALLAAPQGGLYRSIDRDASPGEPYRYRLVEVEASGRQLGYGPYDVDTRQTLSDEGAEAALADEVLREQGYSKTARGEAEGARRARATAAAADQARAAIGSSAPAAKIGVSGSGLYYVSQPQLQSRGVSIPSIVASSLTNRGRAVAFAPSADQAGIYFYGRGPESNVERDNVYRLSGEAGGLLMQTRPNPDVPPPSGTEAYIKTLHAEQDVLAVPNVFSDPDGDFWVWDYVYAGFGAKSFAFRADGAARVDQGSVTVRLKGGTETVADPDHHATFSLNGSLIGETLWDGTQAHEVTLGFDASLLLDGENTLTIDGLTDTGAPYSLFYVDSFDVRFTRTYRAHGNQLECPASGHAAVLIAGFTRPDIAVFDITQPTRPEIVQAPVSQAPDGTYGVVVASTNRQAVYYALAPDALASVSRILPDRPSALRQADNQGEYLVITTEALKATAQSLADQHGDLSSQVVDIEDVYDEFNYGNASPYALRAFLAYARKSWQTPPRYVALAADGSYDYKGVQGFADNLIPPMMANTPFGLFPSDAWFVAWERAPGAEIAIGRLPVTTTGELAEVIRKIGARESALGEPWVESTLLVADDPDGGGDFPLSSEGVARLVPAEAPLSRAYISTIGVAQARNELLLGINQGTGLVSYFGHAGYDQLADEGLLTSADAAAFVNSERPTIMTAMTCLAGNAALPGYAAIGETLVRQQGGGAVAVWAPSGMSENELAGPLAEGFYAAAVSGRGPRIGDAVRTARLVYKASGLPQYMLAIYNLLGDPAMRLR